MSVPASPKLTQVAGLVNRVSNFGAFPPTEAFAKAYKAQGILFNLQDPGLFGAAGMAAQIAGARTHIDWAGVWHPVPPHGDDGAARAKWIHDRITAIDAELAKRQEPKLDVVWHNLEAYTLAQWRAFIWGDAPNGIPRKGWRGAGGVRGSGGGYRPGLASGIVDQGFQDGTVSPHEDFMMGRFQYAVEGFYGPTSEWPDMTPNDHPQAIVDRLGGRRSDGTIHPEDAYPTAQVVGCYDAALGWVVANPAKGIPAEPLLVRRGLIFTVERALQAGII